MGFHHKAIHTIYTSFAKFRNQSSCIYMFDIVSYIFSYVKGHIKNIVILDIDEQNTNACICIHVRPCYAFELKLSTTSRKNLNQIMHLKNTIC